MISRTGLSVESRRRIQKCASFAAAAVAAAFFIAGCLANAPTYPTPLVEVYVGGAVVGKQSSGRVGTEAKGVFRHADGSFSTHEITLDRAYRWGQGDRTMQAMLPTPQDEQRRKSFVIRMFAGFALFAVLAITGFIFMPSRPEAK